MKRKSFIKTGIIGFGSLIASPALLSACSKSDDDSSSGSSTCKSTPKEIAGPFPIKSPADMVKSNIIGDREGIPLVIRFIIQDTNNNCEIVEGVSVDVWQCDAHGNYSEYNNQQEGDFTTKHFLRGRQVTDTNGEATFVSIYPGWYPGRAPHLHVEIKDAQNKSLLITQIAFPEDISSQVYTSEKYTGDFDTSNSSDGSFSNSLSRNIADSVAGDNNSGYTLMKIIKVSI